MRRNAIVAIILDIDGLPDDCDFILVKAGIGEQFMDNLIGFQKTRRFGHHGVQAGDHTKAFF